MHSSSVHRAWKWLSLIITLILLISFTQPESSLAATTAPSSSTDALSVVPLFPTKFNICVGQIEKFAVLVVDSKYISIPKASVHVKEAEILTKTNGVAKWSATGDRPGRTNVTFYVTKKNYDQSKKFNATVNVLQCSWKLRMDYTEEFVDTASAWILQGSVEVGDTPFGVAQDGSITLK